MSTYSIQSTTSNRSIQLISIQIYSTFQHSQKILLFIKYTFFFTHRCLLRTYTSMDAVLLHDKLSCTCFGFKQESFSSIRVCVLLTDCLLASCNKPSDSQEVCFMFVFVLFCFPDLVVDSLVSYQMNQPKSLCII